MGCHSRAQVARDFPRPVTPAWTVQRVTGFTLTHPWAAHDPACPDGPHPTRDCGCRVFRTESEARTYIQEKTS